MPRAYNVTEIVKRSGWIATPGFALIAWAIIYGAFIIAEGEMRHEDTSPNP